MILHSYLIAFPKVLSVTDQCSLLVVQTNSLPGRDREFNQWYNEVHIPEVLALDGFRDCRRFSLSQAQMTDNLPQKYFTLYEISGDPQEALNMLNAAFETMTVSEAFDESTAEFFVVDSIAY